MNPPKPRKVQRVVCPWCGATYNTSMIFRHIIHTCPTCGKRYKLTYDLESTVRVVEVLVEATDDDV